MTVIRIIDASVDDRENGRHDAIVRAAMPAFAGEHPADVGSALAEPVATWIAAHQMDDAAREELLALHLKSVRSIVPLIEEAMNEHMKAESGGLQ